MNILSLCDGISCGQVALDYAGIKYNKYIASEINDDSIRVTQNNYPSTIQIGNMENLLKIKEDGDYIVKDKLKTLEKIDLIIGGTPCQGLSRAKLARENLKDYRSKLFYNFVYILNWLRENNNKDILFLLENVIPDKDTQAIMNEMMGCEPLRINSVLVSAQRRDRLYWTNINNGDIPQPKPQNIKIKDIVYDNAYKTFTDERIEKTKKETKNYLKYDLSGKGYYSQQDRSYYLDGTYPTLMKANPTNKLNIWLGGTLHRRSHPIEAERAQTLPDNYTSIIESHSKRMSLCGDGWTVKVVAHIFSYLPERFKNKNQ